MKNLYVFKVKWILLFLFFTSSVFAQEYQAWKVSPSKGNPNSLSYAMLIENKFNGVKLNLNSDSNPKDIENVPYLLLLSKYMKLAKENNPKRIMSMFSNEDGSLKHYQKQFKSTPNLYSNFNKVDKVVIDGVGHVSY